LCKGFPKWRRATQRLDLHQIHPAALQAAAAIWRRQGGGPIWPALIAVAKTLRGEPESNARRLLSRLLQIGQEDFERADIGDFWFASLFLGDVFFSGVEPGNTIFKTSH
jgi:hypothetical protein